MTEAVASVSEVRSAARVRTDRVGVVVHPSRNVDAPLRGLFGWAGDHGVAVVQVPIPGQDRTVTQIGSPGDCDLIVSIGGDGTMLAAMRAAVAADRPVLGIACGSLGVLTSVSASAIAEALERFRGDDWVARLLPALIVGGSGNAELFALNDVAVVRAGIGQVRVTTHVDGILFSRLAGDGCIVSTPLGSTAYSLAAGGPLLTPDTCGFAIAPLPTHGGSHQPLVVGADAELELQISTGIGGARLEVDGQIVDIEPERLTVSFRPDVATVVSFSDQEPFLTALRRRGIIVDSPRILAEDARR
ncbi:MAG: NAD(+)/NADH kinase [Solirubrobacteraceae bacterium]